MVTKADIARAAGVSRTCVSLVLNDRPGVRIAAGTRRRVLETARRMGYPPDGSTAAAETSPRNVLYVLGSGDQPLSRMRWHLGMMVEMQQHILDDDRFMTFISTTSTPAAVAKVVRAIDRLQPTGVVLDGIVPERLVKAIQARQCPMVVLGVTPYAHEAKWQGRVNTVSLDVKAGVRWLMSWLSEHGGRHIAFACGDPKLLINRLILEGYQEAVAAMGLQYDPALVQVCASDQDGRHLLSRLRALGIEHDSLIIGSQSLAQTILTSDELRSESLLAGVVGLDGRDELARWGAAGVYTQFADHVRRGYELLCMQIKHPQRKPQDVQVPLRFHDPSRHHAR